MNDSYLDLSVLIDSTPGPNPEVRDRLSTRLQMLIESEQVGARQRHRGWQRTPWTHRAGVIAVAAAIVVVFFVPLPHVSLFHSLVSPAKVGSPTNPPTKLPVVDVSATPAGWVPVAYGDAQVSVPKSFAVYYPSQNLCGSPTTPGEVYVAPVPLASNCLTDVGTSIIIVPLRWAAPPSKDGYRTIVVNGVKVDLVFTYGPISTIDFYVPSLGVDVSASGPLARRVVNTLTRSPRTVAMAPGSAPTVPSWQTMTFQGLSFAAPGTWQVMRTSDNLGIGYPCTTPGVALVGQRGIVLSTDQQLAVYHCPGVRPLSLTPQEGVQVDVGSHTLSQWNLHIVFSTHCLSLHGLTACPATSAAYSILVLKVTVPGRNKPVYVSIGLAGNGMVARTILYSLRASPAIGHPLQVAGTIAGTLVRVGGPSPGAPVALPGQVTARSSAGRRFTVTVGKNGKFVLSVSPGEYKLTGHSPLVSQETCMATKPVRVKTGQRVSGVEVICSIS